MPSIKAKQTPSLSPKQNKRERIDGPDKKSKKRDQSPSKTFDKKRKNADNREKRVKSPLPSTSLHEKKRLSSPTKQEKDKQLKKEAALVKVIKLEIPKPIRLKKQELKKEKEPEKRFPLKFAVVKRLKRPHSSGSQKLIKRPLNEIKFIPSRSKSQKAICVNTVKHWYSPLDSDNISDSSINKDSNSDLNDTDPKRSALKRLLRRQLWYVSKGVIKRNEDWSKLMAENRIDVDKINIDALDLSLIDIDALGIENKLLKRTITWFLK